MAKWVPFTVHVKVHPANSDKRVERWRDLQKIAIFVYEGLETISPDYINIAQPGGGQHRSYGGLSGLSYGCAMKPQFGDTPPQLQITGFYNSSSANIQPHSDVEIIHSGETRLGNRSNSSLVGPVATIDNEVKALKSLLESAIFSALPGGVEFSIFRIDYSGVVYGDRGYHFPL